MHCSPPHLDPLTLSLSRRSSSSKDDMHLDSSHDLWSTFSLPTPPTSPVDIRGACQETGRDMGWHSSVGPWTEFREISVEELKVDDDLPFNDYARELTWSRTESPAILNDIMWSGDHVKRPDSTTDFLARFSVASGPSPSLHEHAINHTYVDADDLFAFSLLTPCFDLEQTCAGHLSIPESCGVSLDFAAVHDNSSDTDEEEIDVVGVFSDKTRKNIVTRKSGISLKTQNNSNAPPTELLAHKHNSYLSGEQESDEGNARTSHNDLERKRRTDLRNRFQCLRKCIPSLEANERVAKIIILRRASELISSLRKEEEKSIALKNYEKERNAELLNKLTKLTKKKTRQKKQMN